MLVLGILGLVAGPTVGSARPGPTFALLSKPERVARAAGLAAELGNHAKVDVDAVGMIEHVEMTLPNAVAPGGELAAALALVGDHPAAFGVRDRNALHGTGDGRVELGEGARWSGGIEVIIDKARVHVFGHLWPLDTPPPPVVDKTALVGRFYGLAGTAPSHCDCRREDHFTTDASSFDVHVGVALVCHDKVLAPRVAFVVTSHFNGTVAGLDDLPWLLDATSHERIREDFELLSMGSGDDYASVYTVATHATVACFYKP